MSTETARNRAAVTQEREDGTVSQKSLPHIGIEKSGNRSQDESPTIAGQAESRADGSTSPQPDTAPEMVSAAAGSSFPSDFSDFPQTRSVVHERFGETRNVEAQFMALDFDTSPEPPEYIVCGLFEPATVNVVSGDTGSGKTWLANSLAVALVTGRGWLGRTVQQSNVLVIDEENPGRVVTGRLRALGLTTAEAHERLRYANRQGVVVGEPAWNRWLAEQATLHDARVILIDTAMAATSVEDVSDNSAVVRLYRDLRSLAEELRCAVILLHHERKRQPGQSRNGGQAMMGARQWAGQADTHLALVNVESTEAATSDGRELRTRLTLTQEKVRDDVPAPPEAVVIESEKDPDGRLLRASVVSDGLAQAEPSKVERLAERMGDTLRERGETMRAGQLATLLGEEQNGTWDAARKHALATRLIEQPKHGYYVAPEVRL